MVPKKNWGQCRFSKVISRILFRPNPVSGRRFRYQTNWVANIINLHIVLPQSVKPPTRFRFGTNHWKPIWGCCTQRLPVSLKPFPICIVTVALIVRSLCLVNQPVCRPTQSGLSSDKNRCRLCSALLTAISYIKRIALQIKK